MKCKKCKNERSEIDFYKSNKTTCKSCVKESATSRRNKNIEKVRAYDRARGNRQSPEYLKKYRERYPNKYKAHNIVNNSIRDKKLFAEPCETCGNKRSVAHHDDYSKPLNVRWLCQAHHKEWHAKNGEGKNAT